MFFVLKLEYGNDHKVEFLFFRAFSWTFAVQIAFMLKRKLLIHNITGGAPKTQTTLSEWKLFVYFTLFKTFCCNIFNRISFNFSISLNKLQLLHSNCRNRETPSSGISKKFTSYIKSMSVAVTVHKFVICYLKSVVAQKFCFSCNISLLCHVGYLWFTWNSMITNIPRLRYQEDPSQICNALIFFHSY